MPSVGSTMKRFAMDCKFFVVVVEWLWLNKNAVGWVCNLRFFVELKISVSSLSSMKAKARRATTRAGSWHRQIQKYGRLAFRPIQIQIKK